MDPTHSNTQKESQHQQRQQRLKEQVDAKIDKATEQRGLLLVCTGNGKGKSTAGFGVVLRAVGHKQCAKVAQFIKGNWACGERNVLSELGVEFAVMATGFTWETQNQQLDREAALAVWQKVKQWLCDEHVDVVLLDELTYMLSYHYLDVDEVVSAIENRPQNQSVVITGRACHRRLLALADTVSEVKNVKHAFEQGLQARKGIDW